MFSNGKKQTSLSIIITCGLEINKRCLRQRNWLGPVQGLPAHTNLLPCKETPVRGLIYRARYRVSLKSKPTFHQWVVGHQTLQGCRELVSSSGTWELVPATQAVGSRPNGAACRWRWPRWVPYRSMTRQYTNKTGSGARASETRGRRGKRCSRVTTNNSQVTQHGVPGLWGAGPEACSTLSTWLRTFLGGVHTSSSSWTCADFLPL